MRLELHKPRAEHVQILRRFVEEHRTNGSASRKGAPLATHRYTIILEREADGGFHAFCPALKGCHSQGDARDEAIDNIREAILLLQDSIVEDLVASQEVLGDVRGLLSDECEVEEREALHREAVAVLLEVVEVEIL